MKSVFHFRSAQHLETGSGSFFPLSLQQPDKQQPPAVSLALKKKWMELDVLTFAKKKKNKQIISKFPPFPPP